MYFKILISINKMGNITSSDDCERLRYQGYDQGYDQVPNQALIKTPIQNVIPFVNVPQPIPSSNNNVQTPLRDPLQSPLTRRSLRTSGSFQPQEVVYPYPQNLSQKSLYPSQKSVQIPPTISEKKEPSKTECASTKKGNM